MYVDPNPNISTSLPPAIMASVLSRVFCCCLRRKRSRNFGRDEESLLIPSNVVPPPPSIPHAATLDRQNLKERMRLIVQAKEGKMVNVNSRLPFNLHNTKTSVALDPSPSSSRGSASPSSHSHSHANSHAHWHVQAHVGAPLTITNGIPSRSPSIASHDGVSTDYEGSARFPILNLRLVRPTFGTGVPARRGRARRRGGDGISRDLVDCGSGEVGDDGTLKSNEGSGQHGSLPSSHTTTIEDGTPRQLVHHPHNGDALTQPSISISPASSFDSKITNLGPLTVSFDD